MSIQVPVGAPALVTLGPRVRYGQVRMTLQLTHTNNNQQRITLEESWPVFKDVFRTDSRGHTKEHHVRGGQGDFKWSDVADDKDRENYLGHSILAPVGRWQKNKDITWYNKEGKAVNEDEIQRAKREEIQRIKAAEEDALSAALGFKPTPRDTTTRGPESSSNAIPLGPARGVPPQEAAAFAEEEEDRRKRKAEKAARKAERAAKRERKLQEKMAKTHKHSSKSSKNPNQDLLRSPRPNRHDIMTAQAAHLIIGPQRVTEGAPPLIVPIPLLENPVLPETTTLMIEITIVLPTRITTATALLSLPRMIDINAQFLQIIVAGTTDAVLDRLTDGVNWIH
ncbi:uncharacterized protein VP01_25g9 [Puccinia sorghi]|uniref:Multiple myeloma tumor-associated protein 2-like N-terminal domain-containing protein n=1 Tax=Puccinia sorghi TaxID=27349 RepID=A0A0L6V599_9BASI|nr:uncharacterized protein VP01_25g9 [Puccinia sorghi]